MDEDVATIYSYEREVQFVLKTRNLSFLCSHLRFLRQSGPQELQDIVCCPRNLFYGPAKAIAWELNVLPASF